MRLRNSKSTQSMSSPSPELELNAFFIEPDPDILKPPNKKSNPPEVVYSLVHNEFRFIKRRQLFSGSNLRSIFRPIPIPALSRSLAIPYYGEHSPRVITLPYKVWMLRALIGDYKVLWVEHEAFGIDVVRKVERDKAREALKKQRKEREEKRRKMLSMISERSWVGESPRKGDNALGNGESVEKGKWEGEGDVTMVEPDGEMGGMSKS